MMYSVVWCPKRFLSPQACFSFQHLEDTTDPKQTLLWKLTSFPFSPKGDKKAANKNSECHNQSWKYVQQERKATMRLKLKFRKLCKPKQLPRVPCQDVLDQLREWPTNKRSALPDATKLRDNPKAKTLKHTHKNWG